MSQRGASVPGKTFSLISYGIIFLNMRKNSAKFYFPQSNSGKIYIIKEEIYEKNLSMAHVQVHACRDYNEASYSPETNTITLFNALFMSFTWSEMAN